MSILFLSLNKIMKTKNSTRKDKMAQLINFIEKNQSSLGALILPENSKDDESVQRSAGELIPLEKPKRKAAPQGVAAPHPAKDFRAMNETIEELDPQEIQPISIIPDYLEPTSSLNPIVVKGPTGCYCIEGWKMIQDAIGSGRSGIACHVFNVREISENELAIRKAAIRMLPQGGRASYAEIIRNARILFNLLASSMETPIIYSHGGVRKGAAFPENREENIRLVLAERLGKSVITISKYLNHAEYLSDEAMSALIQAGADKEFFEKAQIAKRKILKGLKSSGASEEEIESQTSEDMIRIHKDPSEIENLDDPQSQAGDETGGEMAANPPQIEQDAEAATLFEYWKGNPDNSLENPPTKEQIRSEGTEIVRRMLSHFENPQLDLPDLRQLVTDDARNLLSVLHKIDTDPGSSSEEAG